MERVGNALTEDTVDGRMS